ncbi:inositol phosphorylceramide synthase [Pedobacter sp. HMF7056]|uniref:Inositol phosphorylceramide synthase n=2 Tax=Hufsiella ginkgonis TaxID=2695274 RepID=A0A7K1XZS8_9SPHI|nr:phosphatase PAP2 family protein [Hufsiella ginkgonis]MXV16239.1 inositol phosphorylceramide synthase [Hufsiella ginkgonis]
MLLSYLVIGYRPEQLTLVVLFNFLFLVSGVTRNFVTGFSIFIVYWIIFDYMKAFPNYRYHDVDILHIYELEKLLFGIHSGGKLFTPNEFLFLHKNTFLDVLSGIFYLCWIPVPLLTGAFLFFKKRTQFFHFALTFLLVNLLGFIVYYSHPAAPPWYVQYHGFVFDAATKGNTAGLARFDVFFGITVFKSIYEKSSNVFAAMPSLHSAYPLIVLYYGVKNKLGFVNVLFAMVTVGIWFAAVYTSHHYVLDVLSGITCAAVGIALFHFAVNRSTWLKSFILKLEQAASV